MTAGDDRRAVGQVDTLATPKRDLPWGRAGSELKFYADLLIWRLGARWI